MKRTAIALGLWVLTACGAIAHGAPASAPTSTTTTTVAPAPTTTVPPTTTTTTLPPLAFTPLCPTIVQLAREVGWPEDLLPRLDAIAHRESRCDDDENAHNTDDPAGGSYGVMQVNCSWVNPNRWYPDGYLSRVGITDCTQLLDRRTNLVASLELCKYSYEKHGFCWHPWKV